MLEGIVSVTSDSGCDGVSIGDALQSGHPRYSSRAGYKWPMQTFDMDEYLDFLRARAEARAKRAKRKP